MNASVTDSHKAVEESGCETGAKHKAVEDGGGRKKKKTLLQKINRCEEVGFWQDRPAEEGGSGARVSLARERERLRQMLVKGRVEEMERERKSENGNCIPLIH
ncbi:Uncharacterized protein TCM_003131 [Theobroma cacao]|uniref:Uncharacterized protein n=1 Tax=Theobroma cacao TaxID=3641 RepID=A0A061DPN5_THECC|nr:Uncharacterized protein TCM_003131 [Theobroma cacao]